MSSPPAVSPQEILQSLSRIFPELAQTGSALIVGGAIRDLLLGVPPADVDLVVAGAREHSAGFARLVRGRLVNLGRDKFATFRVVVNGRIYDFSELTDGSLGNDLVRRDFTINAMALLTDPPRLHDPHGGARDLESKLVRMVKEENFDEDPLRVLKGVRTAVKYGFTLEPETFRAMRERGSKLGRVSPERVTSELEILFSTNQAAAGRLLREVEIDQLLFGRRLTDGDIACLERAKSRDPVMAYAILMKESEADLIHAFAEKWRWSDRTRKEVIETTSLYRRSLRGELGSRSYAAIAFHDAGKGVSVRMVGLLKAAGYDDLAVFAESALHEAGEKLFSLQPLLSGEEIQRIAEIDPGPLVGKLKRALIEAQIRGEVRTRDEADRFVAKQMRG